MAMDSNTHVAFVAYQAWGHTKPLCTFVARITKLRPICITFFTARQMYERVVAEISRNFEDDERDKQSRIRVVGLDWHEQDPFDVEVFGKCFDLELRKLLNGSPVHCANTKMDIPALRPPTVLLVDIFGYSFLKIARNQSSKLKIFAWTPGSLVAVLGLFGPFELDSVGKAQREVDELASQSGIPLAEAAMAIMYSPTEDMLDVPGLPPMYKYENFPQKPMIDIPTLGLLHLGSHNLIHECDGIIASAFENVEPEQGLQAINRFLGATSRQLYVVGPLLPSTRRAAALEMEQAAKSPEITTFMNQTLQSHGERSLVYISFGTLFWPSEPENLWTFLDVLMERRTPFIMTFPSMFAQIPDEVVERIRVSGLGVITTWAPQQAVLDHPVTGWFVTHSGYNSYSESILAGVPMICWPIAADQAINTVHLTDNLNVAYELLEVRTGDGLRPISRTGKAPSGTLEAVRAEARNVLDQAFGADGAEKRANVQQLKYASQRLWDEDGRARRAVVKFLDSLPLDTVAKRMETV